MWTVGYAAYRMYAAESCGRFSESIVQKDDTAEHPGGGVGLLVAVAVEIR